MLGSTTVMCVYVVVVIIDVILECLYGKGMLCFNIIFV
jgi:hypothetical protein